MGAPQHSEETKAAVMAALLAGQSVYKVADAYKIPVGTVKSWRQKNVNKSAVTTEAQRERVGDLILDNLTALLTATKAIIERVSQDEKWTKEQSASELAVFVGVLYDKAIRIAEALPEPTGAADEDIP